jgi:S-adenosylmethionine:tRNA ribosyltransferase-isomerase
MDVTRGDALCFLDAYDYDLPEELIAQTPAERRDASRLMCARRDTGEIAHRRFSDLPELLRPGDLLVMNDTRVFCARTLGNKIPGGARAEIFFLRPAGDPRGWEALIRPGKILPPGARVALEGGCVVEVEGRAADGGRVVRLPDGLDTEEFFARCGRVPLPHYIRKDMGDGERYQTVYADRAKNRSVAAPTAGLHFTPELLARLDERGVERAFVTLDIGVGTFRPVKTEDVREHRMHTERCAIESEQATRVTAARTGGRRVVAVGTTAVRTLETFADESGVVAPGERDTDIFIRPGYRFKAVDALITNFHLPKSTLLMLVSAFAGHGVTMAAYRAAVEKRYRFFSFGDAMLVE